jgi:hypothetical protein
MVNIVRRENKSPDIKTVWILFFFDADYMTTSFCEGVYSSEEKALFFFNQMVEKEEMRGSDECYSIVEEELDTYPGF